jgi:hypothetical protein
MFPCVFRVFEEKKAFLESSMLKGQFRRKAASNEIENKCLGSSVQCSSVVEQGSSTDALKHMSHRIERIRARSQKHPSSSALALECKRATINRKHELERTTLGSSDQM